MPRIILGSFVFVSGDVISQAAQWGYPPTRITGPFRESHVVEHVVPALEGGVTEYLGSRQSTYRIEGFLAPRDDTNPPLTTSPAGSVLSGAGFVAVNADEAKDFLQGLRSGAQLLTIESTASGLSNQPIQVYYEHDFFMVTSMTFGFEAGRAYPYYPYTIELLRHFKRTYGQSSGLTAAAAEADGTYFSGYIRGWDLASASGSPKGETLVGIGLYSPSAASGNAKVAVYDASTLRTQSASQPVKSGWNYFPLRPTFTTVSGTVYTLAFKGDATSTSGFTVGSRTGAAGDQTYVSGVTYSDAFPASQGFTASGNKNFSEMIII